MEEKTILHSLLQKICGKKYVLMITDASEIMSRQEKLENDPQLK